MAEDPEIKIGFDYEQLKREADKASQYVRDAFKKAYEGFNDPQSTQKIKRPRPRLVPDPEPPQPGGKRGESWLDKMLWGGRGKAAALSNVRTSMQEIANVISNSTLGKIGVQNLGSTAANFGIGGGLAIGGAAALVAGLAGTILKGRGIEKMQMSTAPMLGRGGYQGAGLLSKYLVDGKSSQFSDDEALPMIQGAGRAGAEGGLSSIFKAQRGYGLGGDLTGVLGKLAGKGEKIDDARASKILRDAVATGTYTGLTNGRLGEMLTGMSQLINSRGLGMGANTDSMTAMAMNLGSGTGKGMFSGAAGFEAAGTLDRLVTSPHSAFGQVASLRASGLGGKYGRDIFAARRQMEKGMFSEGGNVNALDEIMGYYKKSYGINGSLGTEGVAGSSEEMRRGMAVANMASDAGTTGTAMQAMLRARETGVTDPKVLKGLLEKGTSLTDQANKAMISMAKFQGLETAVSKAFTDIWAKVQPTMSGLLKQVTLLVQWLDKAVPQFLDTRTGKSILNPSDTLKNIGEWMGEEAVKGTNEDTIKKKNLKGIESMMSEDTYKSVKGYTQAGPIANTLTDTEKTYMKMLENIHKEGSFSAGLGRGWHRGMERSGVADVDPKIVQGLFDFLQGILVNTGKVPELKLSESLSEKLNGGFQNSVENNGSYIPLPAPSTK